MGIDEPGQDDFASAVDLDNSLTILFQPGIAESVFSGADGNDFSSEAKDRPVFDNSEFFEGGTAAWTGQASRRPESNKLANVGEYQSLFVSSGLGV